MTLVALTSNGAARFPIKTDIIIYQNSARFYCLRTGGSDEMLSGAFFVSGGSRINLNIIWIYDSIAWASSDSGES